MREEEIRWVNERNDLLQQTEQLTSNVQKVEIDIDEYNMIRDFCLLLMKIYAMMHF